MMWYWITLHAPAGLWLKRREELGFPLGLPSDLEPPRPAHLQGSLGTEPADVVVEVGCESCHLLMLCQL